MKTHLAVVMFLSIACAQADLVQLTDGQQVQGKVTGYTGKTFELQTADGKTNSIQVASVKQISFTPRSHPSVLETRSQGRLEANLVSYEDSQFMFRTASGATIGVPADTVAKADLTGQASASQKAQPIPGHPHSAAATPNVADVEEVQGTNLNKYLVPGQIVIVDFYADWCGPCRTIGPVLEKIARDDASVVLRKVNVDRNKTLAQNFGVHAIPHVIVFDAGGRQVGTVVGASKDRVQSLIKRAKGES